MFDAFLPGAVVKRSAGHDVLPEMRKPENVISRT